MFLVVRSNDSFNFPLGLIKYIVIVISGIATALFSLMKNFRVWKRNHKAQKAGSPLDDIGRHTILFVVEIAACSILRFFIRGSKARRHALFWRRNL